MLIWGIGQLEAFSLEKIAIEQWLDLFEGQYGLKNKPADQKAKW